MVINTKNIFKTLLAPVALILLVACGANNQQEVQEVNGN